MLKLPFRLVDKMMLKIGVIVFIIAPFCIGQQLDKRGSTGKCSQRNISCDNVKITDGYKFPHGGPKDCEVFIYANKTLIANGLMDSKSFNYTDEVLRMDNFSVTTTHCQDLKVEYIIDNTDSAGKTFVKETCMYLITTGKSSERNESPNPWGYILGGVAVMIAVIGVLCWCYMSWKKEQRRQPGAATPCGFFQYQLTCSCLRKGIFLAEGGELQETRHHDGTELQEVTAGDSETQQNNDSRNVNHHDRDPRGSGENETGDENTLRSVIVHSEDTSSPNVNRESLHRAMNRNTRDDPGGANCNERQDTIRKMASGCAVGDHDAEDHETEGRPLLPNQRPTTQGFDMTGEAIALVNKPGFDPNQVSRCSVAPETDVESTKNMKN